MITNVFGFQKTVKMLLLGIMATLLLVPQTQANTSNHKPHSFISNKPISKPNKDKFMFLINSDPQMGDEHTEKKGLKILNELLEMFVKETNERKGSDKADFVVWDGDLVWDAFQNAFDNFQRIVSALNIPSIMVHGNHDGLNDDPKFLNMQEKITGYRKLNYSFDYGQWHFIVIKSEEKYLKEEQKKAMLDWLDAELKKNKDKQVMLFMHYHILPTGLSQMEFYTYFPMQFKNEMLETITRYKNVKYVFSGHVHIGIKASIKTARNYKGTNFILAPTPVFARPFGEEFPQFREKGDKYDRRGFYTEIHVDGNKVDIVGRKINHPFKKKYPRKFKTFDPSQDIRSFIPEGQLPVNKTLFNGDFSQGLLGWNSSYRYQKDGLNMFDNHVDHGISRLHFTASFGSWTFDEYMENYQVVHYQDNMKMEIKFNTLPTKIKGSGGYYRVFAYDKEGRLLKILLFHWGTQEQKVKFMHQSWGYNATGERLGPLWLNKEIKRGNMLAYFIEFEPLKEQKLEVDLSQLFQQLTQDGETLEIDRIAIAYGVWGRVSIKGRKFTSKLNVDSIHLYSDSNEEAKNAVVLNGAALLKQEKELKFGQIYKRIQAKKKKEKN